MERTLTTCLCQHWPANLISEGFFPASPTNLSIFFDLDVLELFIQIFHSGPISKRSFTEGLRRYHEIRQRMLLLNFTKPFYNALTHWLETQRGVKVELDSWLHQTSQSHIFALMVLLNLCPSCFYTSGTAPEKVLKQVIIGINGNFQHR